MKPSIERIVGYFRSGTLAELRARGRMSKTEYTRLVADVKAHEAKSSRKSAQDVDDIGRSDEVSSK